MPSSCSRAVSFPSSFCYKVLRVLCVKNKATVCFLFFYSLRSLHTEGRVDFRSLVEYALLGISAEFPSVGRKAASRPRILHCCI